MKSGLVTARDTIRLARVLHANGCNCSLHSVLVCILLATILRISTDGFPTSCAIQYISPPLHHLVLEISSTSQSYTHHQNHNLSAASRDHCNRFSGYFGRATDCSATPLLQPFGIISLWIKYPCKKNKGVLES